ncbi:hypothetical protein ACEWY4_001554 [Coilia grayii]|uniref:Gypsy retrotransposon integrase-like protein 1 n=1 Tax=Coilia grayii TaxID=363190 RepID=A0ABD1KT95_9TELE
MAYHRLRRDDQQESAAEEEENDDGAQTEGARGGAAGEPQTLDLGSLYSLLQQSMQDQQREAHKQDMRWRGVQIQLNNVYDELERERRRAAEERQHPGRDDVGAPLPRASPRSPGAPPPGRQLPTAPPAAPLSPVAAPRLPPAQPAVPPPVPDPATLTPVAWTRAAVPKLEEGDDIEQYLTTFERLAMAYRWPRADWAIYLVPYLTGRARAAYVAMDMQEAMEYDRVKAAILAKYEISEETYRQRFRKPEVRAGETPRELYNRLMDLYRKWVRPAGKTVEEIGEIIVLEQYLRTLAPDIRVWVKEHNPATGQQAADLVEAFLAARPGPKMFRSQHYSRPAVGGKSGGTGGGVGPRGWGQVRAPHHTYTGPYTSPPRPPTRPYTPPPRHSAPTATAQRQPIICHHCGKPGHMIRDCPVRKAQGSSFCNVPRPEVAADEALARVQTIPVVVNDQATVALLDTGSTHTLVQPHLIDPSEELGKGQLRVCCVNGDEHVYPVADICLIVNEQAFLLRAGIVKGLRYPVVLGQDVLILPELVRSAEPISMVVTRAQAKQSTEEVANKAVLDKLPYSQCDIDPPVANKMRKTRRQRRVAKLKGAAEKSVGQLPKPDGEVSDLWEPPSNLSDLQKSDESLKDTFCKVTEIDGVRTGVAPGLSGEFYFVRDGLLYHQPEDGSVEQVVVPKGLRDRVLSLGHDIPWAGHLGTVKTLERIAQRFHWPGLYADVQRYCRTCPICQLTSKHKAKPSPLQPLPIIGIPFQRIGMDIVGPLEKTRSGHRFILVICDYATRYPEAFPLRKITAGAVARALLQLISRVGIPHEVLTDQGTAFLSKTLKQVYSLLGIKGVRTTPYHPQTDGLVERYNQTLKSMLKKFVAGNGKDWDQWLPYLLFAYREVPQASTGFSPFELLYGRQVRGPLDLLRDAWVTLKPQESDSVLSYVLKMRDKMEEMSGLVEDNMTKAQQNQARWYDQRARERSFRPGQQVLLLLPTTENKLLARWQGPYAVTRQLGPVTYELEMPGRRKTKQVFHVNLLKEWREREAPLSQQLLVQDVQGDVEVQEQFFPAVASPSEPDISHLTAQQAQELKAIIPPGLFSEQPGRTSWVEHDLHLKDSTPVRQRMYRIPERLLPALQEELDVMKRLKVIERSSSSWSSPVVLVPKKDGSIRFCIDFRQLNAQSTFDAYPMPRLEDLIEGLGRASFITTLDLCRGYWQVPLAEGAKQYTAFRTPQGLYQFTTMPFGLQGAPATFQRLMDRVLEGTGGFAAAYLDDVVIWSATWGQHLQHLAEVFRRISEAGLTVQPKKCSLAQQEVRYLGHIIGKGVIKPQKDKVEAVRDCPRPQTKKDVRSFLGLAGWYRRFIPNFATRAAPLTDLTKKSGAAKVQWGDVQERAFQDLKGALLCEPVLQSPDFEQPFTVQTDASGVGLGAVLLQGEAEQQKPVAYISRKLFPRETRYSVVELECLAVKWALETFKYYLLGRDFLLETDHKALQWLGKMKDSNARITRWFLSLQPFRFTVQYRAGAQNPVADFLSRHPGGEPSEGGGNVKNV